MTKTSNSECEVITFTRISNKLATIFVGLQDKQLRVEHGTAQPGGSTPTYDMIYLLTAIVLIPGGSSTVQYSRVQYTFTHKQYTEQHRTTQ